MSEELMLTAATSARFVKVGRHLQAYEGAMESFANEHTPSQKLCLIEARLSLMRAAREIERVIWDFEFSPYLDPDPHHHKGI